MVIWKKEGRFQIPDLNRVNGAVYIAAERGEARTEGLGLGLRVFAAAGEQDPAVAVEAVVPTCDGVRGCGCHRA
jgi:hypothetical protein